MTPDELDAYCRKIVADPGYLDRCRQRADALDAYMLAPNDDDRAVALANLHAVVAAVGMD